MTISTEQTQEIYEAAVHEEATGNEGAAFELLCKLDDAGGTGATIRKLIDMVRARDVELLAVKEAQPVFFIEIEGDDWINAGRVPGSTFDFSNLPDGINHLYTATPALPANVIGRPATPDDSPYPATIAGGCLLAQAWADGYNARNALTVAPAAPQSDHLKRALKLAGEAKELADRIRAEEQTSPAVLGEQLINIANHIAGSEGGLPDEWKDWANELVSDLRRLAASKSAPILPGEAEFKAWVHDDYNREVTLSCPVNLGIARSAWNAYRDVLTTTPKGD